MVGSFRGVMIGSLLRAASLFLTLPWRAGESHVRFGKFLRSREKLILKVALDSDGAADDSICGVFRRTAGPSREQCSARSDGDFFHRLGGDAVWGNELHRHGAVCADEGVSLGGGAGTRSWSAEPRHLQPRVPHA